MRRYRVEDYAGFWISDHDSLKVARQEAASEANRNGRSARVFRTSLVCVVLARSRSKGPRRGKP